MREEDIEVKAGVVIPGHELWFTTSRSSGPGGQHANKTESRVTIHWAPGASSISEDHKARILRRLESRLTSAGVLQISVQEERSQHRNKELSRERLAEVVRQALHRKKKRIATRPTLGSKRRRLKAKKRRGEVKRSRGRVDRDHE